MPISVSCSGCNSKLKAPDNAVGKKIKCPKCSTMILVSATVEAEVPAAAPGKSSGVRPKPPALPPPEDDYEEPRSKKRRDEDDEAFEEAPRSKGRAARDDDYEEPRNKKRRDEEDEEPRSKKRRDEEDEDEAPRSKKRREEDDDYEEPRSKKRRDDEDFEEAPRSKRRRDEDFEEAPRGRRGRDEDDRDRDGDDEDEVPAINVPEDIEDKIREELSKGEKLIWAGQQSPRIIKYKVLGTIIGGSFGLLVTVIVVIIFWVIGFGDGHGKIPTFLLFIPGLFLLASLGALIWGPMAVHIVAKKTAYVITNRRAIVWTGAWFGEGKVDNYTPVHLQNMDRRDSWWVPGAGDLVFATRTEITVSSSRHGGTNVSRREIRYGFLGIDNIRKVEKVLREALIDKLIDKYTA